MESPSYILNDKETHCVACIFGPYKMGWGKHKGEVLTDLPKSYLIWLAETQGYEQIILDEFECLEHHKDRVKYYEEST